MALMEGSHSIRTPGGWVGGFLVSCEICRVEWGGVGTFHCPGHGLRRRRRRRGELRYEEE